MLQLNNFIPGKLKVKLMVINKEQLNKLHLYF